MARNIQDILTQIQNARLANSNLNAFNNTSQVSIFNLLEYLSAVELNLEEQNWDLFQEEIEALIAGAPIGTPQWLKKEILLFQYDTSIPQVLDVINYIPQYNPIDTTKQIITRVSAKTQPNRIVNIKVATLDPPQALDNLQLSALIGYLDIIGFLGIQLLVTSLNADKLYLGANITYDGQYSSVIQANVEAAINTYLANLEFDGIVRVAQLEKAILNVTGVIDILTNDLGIRADSSSNYTWLVTGDHENMQMSTLYAGYAVPETNGGFTLADTMIYTPQN